MEENKHNQHPDLFSEKIRQKLEGHMMPVDADVWKGIEKRIAPKKRIVPGWLYASVAVAAGLALLFSVGNFIYLRDDLLPVSEEIVQHRQESQQFVVVPEETVHPEVTGTDDAGKGSRAAGVRSGVQQADPEKQIALIAEAEPESMEVKAEVSVEELAEVQPKKDVVEPEHDLQKKRESEQLSLPADTQRDWTDIVPRKAKAQPLLAAAVGSGVASSSVSIPGRSRAFRNQHLVNLGGTTNVLTPNDFKHKEYLPPFSVGLSARMPLTDRLAVESGVAYTYLLTRLSGSTSGDYRAEVKLHYLGVPLNMVWTLLKERKWEIYVSGGGMIEKGLRTDFRQYQNWDNVEMHTSANTEVDGVQWSLNGTLGVGYNLQKNISLFFDPKLSYYFESEQPFSIRKELPVLVSLNTGLRMSF